MVILFLTNNSNTRRLYQWLVEQERMVYLLERPIDLETVNQYKPQMVISYNYNYMIKEDVISYLQGNIINLHISLLPWNRGASPNLWSFLDNTPKGVSIHYIDNGLDTGNIIIQKELEFNANEETFVSTYEHLHLEIQKLFIENWRRIKDRELPGFPQRGDGSYHKMRDTKEMQRRLNFSWNDNIGEVLKKYAQLVCEG